ncbi:Oligoendopeptidase F-like protein [Alteracholeplasma palmae J233]|uniref:Oligopeptidase F n=1 Tax=Alteracholeplasma palmae (strain ATCC 49389 / J233) TaxID=1318466 RepID=U4KL44_ALTPJ|nr:oligoendopeptidase F [Alteracholeplasma palmae]CCV64599.1 Oligoendopeptidase F-like protein [Alteracholeplasma palmae J233]
MKKQLPKRSEVNVAHTWDLNTIYKDENAYEKTLELLLEQVISFKTKFEHKLNNAKTINDALTELQEIQGHLVRLSAYQSLFISVDATNPVNQTRSARFGNKYQTVLESITFITTELNEVSLDILEEAKKLSKENESYLEDVIKERAHILSSDAQKTVVALSQTLNAPYTNYQRFKINDMKFPDFEVNTKKFPNSFTLFENEWEYESNTEIRRKAYESFYDVLAQYQNGFASNYQAHLQKEKAFSKLKKFDSTIEYLLWNQDVSRDMMDRQIDVIMKELSPVMRKYARLLKKIHHLDELTYADLKIAIDPSFEPKVTIEESKNYLLDGLSILGSEYSKMVQRSFDERWTDFPQNIGKSTGGFCSSPYGANSFILVNWNGQMDEVMVLAHELGHAGHFQYANKYQNIFNTRPSMYFIEAPSTTNELIMSRHLVKNATDKRLKRWILSVMISRTYYHNFVTHLLEAAFQREVYTALDNNQPLTANTLNQYKLKVLKDFWKDDVVIPDYAGLTWMRQPHYFMGLYPYTYSAGLTLGTEVSKQLFEGTIKADEWINVLKAGGTKKPLDLAKMVGIDLSTDKALKNAIQFISNSVDEIERLTEELEK